MICFTATLVKPWAAEFATLRICLICQLRQTRKNDLHISHQLSVSTPILTIRLYNINLLQGEGVPL
jgi:hypothetical protein